jgi:glycosyltransferase involved in cell wall biosynthesis
VTSTQLATRFDAPPRAETTRTILPSVVEERRVLVAVRWPVGGIRTHILYNYPTAAEHGYRFTFVGPADETFERFAASMTPLPDCEFVGVEVQGPRCRMWPRLRRLLRTGRFAFVHSHGLTAACHGALAALATGVPHLATVHDVLRPEQFPGLRGRLKRWLMGRLLRRVDDFILPGRDVHANLLDYLPVLRRGRCRLHVIPNGIDTAHYACRAPSSSELRRRLGLADDVVLIGFLGRFMEQKGFLPLLSAIERLIADGPPAPFHVAAFGSGDYSREYAAAARRRNLTRFVTQLDAVADVKPILGQLDLLVMPSLWEALPLLPMEAMAAGVPVLGSDCPGLREVLHDTPSRMVPAGDVAELARGLRQAIAAPWTAAARAVAPTACARFDNARSAARLVELFGQTAARR